MKPVPQPDHFQALDACHQQIHDHLAQLTSVLEQIQAGADEAQYREPVRVVEAFFSATATCAGVFPSVTITIWLR